jgi:hypothetical protein
MTPSWRPRNETESDRQNESAAASRIAVKFNCELVKLSEALYHVDWCLHRNNEVVAFAEYKRRRKSYPNWILSFAKYLKGIELASMAGTGARFVFFIETDDRGIIYHTFNEQSFPVVLAGNSRGQQGDVEPCIRIPDSMFKPL